MLPIRWELPDDGRAVALLDAGLRAVRIGQRVRIDRGPELRLGDELLAIDTRVHASRAQAPGAYQALLHVLVRLDVWCRRQWAFPSCTCGAIGYELERVGEERFCTTAAMFVRQRVDCEDLSCDRVAELQLAGVHAAPRLLLEHETPELRQWHVDIVNSRGEFLEDPARFLEGFGS